VLYVLYAVHVLVCIFLILVVLLQQGKGADLSVFGGGSTQTAFGARGATTLLHKLTVVSFVVFVLTTLLIGLPQIRRGASVMGGGGTTAPAPTAPAKPAPGSQR
jgi:preprotein translocase subunit SecG